MAVFTEPTQENVLTEVFLSDVSSLFIMILAIVGISGEWRHRTITSSLLAAPDRLRFLAAKMLAFAIAGMVLSALVSIAVTIAGFAIIAVFVICRHRTSASCCPYTRATRWWLRCWAHSASVSARWCATRRSRL